MEIRATTIIFAKRKARQKRDEEKKLLMRFNSLQECLCHNFDESIKAEMDRVKNKLAKIIAVKTQSSAANPAGMNSEKRTVNIFTTSKNEITGKNILPL